MILKGILLVVLALICILVGFLIYSLWDGNMSNDIEKINKKVEEMIESIGLTEKGKELIREIEGTIPTPLEILKPLTPDEVEEWEQEHEDELIRPTQEEIENAKQIDMDVITSMFKDGLITKEEYEKQIREL